MTKTLKAANLIIFGTLVVMHSACTPGRTNSAPVKESFVRTEVITSEVRAKMTPSDVLQSFKNGNKNFVNSNLTARDHTKLVRSSASGQFPLAAVISCLDSRIPVEDIFDKSIGDVFVGRIAGNFVNVDLLGSLEFACKVAGAKLIIIIGHDHCGAIKGAIDNVKLGNLTATLSNIRPVVEKTKPVSGQKNSSNEEYVQAVAKNNVVYNIDYVRKNSPILKEMEESGRIKIVGAFYDMETGNVEFIEM